MHVHALGWILLVVLILILISIDFFGHVRKPHAPSLKEAAAWSVGYMALAACFGLVVWFVWGLDYAGQYYAGWLTEWSLSLDNLFVFIIIMTAFRVPREYQQKVLLYGIAIALVLRAIFIVIGAALIAKFSFVFYLFGAFLLWTAYTQARAKEPSAEPEADEYHETGFVRAVRKVIPTTDGFVGPKLLHRHAGKTYITPLLLVILALGSADLMFAFDSIPAIFGLTKEPYIVFAANAFALLGLRQLFFLIDGLLERLVYLHYGLALILGFIGCKLIIHAMHENDLSFINGGDPILVIPEPTIAVSLTFILVVLIGTAVFSILATRKANRNGNGAKGTESGEN